MALHEYKSHMCLVQFICPVVLIDRQYFNAHTNCIVILQVVMLSVVFQAAALLLTLSCGVYGQGLTDEDMEEILNAHNFYRRSVDPIATNMLKMVYTITQ